MDSLWLLLDCDYLCHRARYSMGDLSWKGAATGVIYGFLQAVIHLQEQFQTDKVAFCFDSKHSKRQDIYPDYKAQRKNRQTLTPDEKEFERAFHIQRVKLRKEYLPEIGFNNIFQQRGYESDDLLARISLDLPKTDQAIIVTADQDIYQCLSDVVKMYNPQKRELMTIQKFKRVYGIHPAMWARVKALAGCSSDNVKGLPGIGEKTVLKWMTTELKPTTKAYQKLDSQEAEQYIVQNLPLVSLPFKGTHRIKLQDDNITRVGWRKVSIRLGFKTLHPRGV